MKIDWLAPGLKYFGSEEFWAEPWEAKSGSQRARETAWAWDQWAVASCAERNHGHRWRLDWDEEDGLRLHCRHCPAGVDELYPDGQDLICGELPVPGSIRSLCISGGSVDLNAPVQEWHGPVRAEVWTRVYHSREYPDEHDCGITVEAL